MNNQLKNSSHYGDGGFSEGGSRPNGRAGRGSSRGLPRNLRNNNPCNIRSGGCHWQGQAQVQTDPSFVVFTSMAMGYRAAFKLLESYRNRFIIQHKPWTIRSIIERWAPPNENHTAAYISQVVKLTGIPADQILLLPEINGKDAAKILAAMTVVEGGIQPEQVNWDDIREGYRKAWPMGDLPLILPLGRRPASQSLEIHNNN